MRRTLLGKKLLVASLGVATVSYVVAACGGDVQRTDPIPTGNTFFDGARELGDVEAGPRLADGNAFDVQVPSDVQVPFDAADASGDAHADAPNGD